MPDGVVHGEWCWSTTYRARAADAAFPADPYPGTVPPFSFVHLDGWSHPLHPSASGWRIGGPSADLDLWLAGHGADPLAHRIPLLTYGSNRCPSKITWLRRQLGLAGPVVVLRARTEGVAAVWASGVRHRDGQRTSVLAAAPGVVERHALWLATPEQVEVLDRCEGRDERYRLARLHTGTVRTDDGVRVDAPWCYLGLAATRRPLLVDGHPVRCAQVDQAAALHLEGDAAPDDGLLATTITGAPQPHDWPAALFVYGLLQPGQPSWPLVTGHAAGEPRRTTVAGTVHDTRRGYPALLAGDGAAPGWVVPVRDPAVLLARLDDYEGPEYRRVRVATADGEAAWAYLWAGSRARLDVLPHGWPA